MLNDIKREKRLRDRLEELKMLCQPDSEWRVSGGRFENKEGWFGRKNAVNETPKKITRPALTAEGKETLVDLEEYVILCAWSEWGKALNGMDHLFECELRYYYLPINEIHYIKDGVDYGERECEHSKIGHDRYTKMLNEYKVISQKIDFGINEKITEIREYKDGTLLLWQFNRNEWKDITPPDYYDV